MKVLVNLSNNSLIFGMTMTINKSNKNINCFKIMYLHVLLGFCFLYFE